MNGIPSIQRYAKEQPLVGIQTSPYRFSRKFPLACVNRLAGLRHDFDVEVEIVETYSLGDRNGSRRDIDSFEGDNLASVADIHRSKD